MFDLLIKNGRVADGTGKPIFEADVALANGRIVEVGRIDASAKRTIDAGGLLVTPGFVDIHTHFDGQVSWDSELAPSSVHGVTSTVMGNCGLGFAPARPDKREWLIGLMEAVEDVPGTALAEGLAWDWETFPEYLDALARRRFTIDVGTQLPHAALRAYVMGDRGADPHEAATDAEAEEMGRLTFEAVQAGALGFSTSRTYHHHAKDGRLLGSTYAGDNELNAIARGLRQAGKGVGQLISDVYQHSDPDYVANELRVIRNFAQISGRPTSFTVVQTMHSPNTWRTMMRAAADMAEDGLQVRTQVAPRGVGALVTLRSTSNPFRSTATHQSLASLPIDDQIERMKAPDVRRAILADYAALDPAGMQAVFHRAYDRMFPMREPIDHEPAPENSLAGQAARLGRDPAELLYDLLMENDGRGVLQMPFVNYTDGNLDSTFEMLTDPSALFGLSDAGAHCGGISDGSFPTMTLSFWSKGNRSGRRMSVEAIVHGYTQRTAEHVGWRDRGVVAPDYLADLNVIDLDRLDVDLPYIAYDLPLGSPRFLQKARGYAFTIKRGLMTVEGGELTGELPGRLVRGAQVK